MKFFSLVAPTAILLPLVLMTGGCGDDSATGPPGGMNRVPTVTVAAVEKNAIPDEFGFVGRVGTKSRVDIRAQVEGVLLERYFEEGAMVKKGDLLFQIEPADYEAALASAKAQVASAQALADKADQYEKRLKAVKRGGVSPTEMEVAVIEARTAKASLDQMIAAQKTAELNLKRTRILAPIDGQIGKAMLNAGNLVDASAGTLATIVQVDPIRVKHSLSERFLTQAVERSADRDPNLPPIRDSLITRIVLSTGNPYPYEGKIVFLDNEVSSTTGTIQAEAEFPNPDGILKPGQFVDLTVQRGAPVDRLTVPQSAVQQDQQGHFVLVTSAEGEVAQRRVTLGERVGVSWIVLDGLAAGEKVVVQGVEKIRQGSKVNAVEVEKMPASSEIKKPIE
ncbi:MAG: efflux RND transporter periplasmic adaptor subunit [Verrucomicrobiales bacterium]|nr:efflux RND transporter periplasmic adaptor subunit [Verrucomicrobiales bacterium]